MDFLSRQSEAKVSPGVRAAGLAAISLLLSTFVWSPAIKASPLTQSGDGQYFHRVMEIAKVTVRRYHEVPLWNPYECGGVPLWDNPEMPVASPLVYLTIGLPATETMWVWYILHSAFGFVAMWLFARRELQLSRPAALAASCLWAFGVGHVTQYAGGHATLCNFYVFPLAVLMWRRAEKSLDYAVGLGLLFSFVFFEGGAYPLVHTGLLLGVETALRLFNRPNILGILRAGVVVGAVAGGVSACRLLPVLDQVAAHKRELGIETDAMQKKTLEDMFFARQHSWGVPGQTYVWPEFASYFGFLAIGLAIVGLLVAGAEVWWWVFVGVAAFLLMCGHFHAYAPWHLLKTHVFPFTSMRVPSRYRLYVAAFIATFVGLAVDRLPLKVRQLGGGRTGTELARVFALGIALMGAGDVMAVASETVGIKWTAGPITQVTPSPRLYLEGPGLASFLDQPRQNRGRFACADSWPFTEGAPLWVGDVPQARGFDTKAQVDNVKRTPNTFTFVVNASEPARVLVNTAYEVGWQTTVGKTADASKQLAIDVPAGSHQVKVYYWPRRLTLGIIVTALALSASLAFLFRKWLAELVAEIRARKNEKA